jgi:MscS family membrane protein
MRFLKATERGDFKEGAEYLDVRTTPAKEEELARQLAVVLNHGLSGNLGSLSRSPEGSMKDDLRTNRDRVGFVETKSGKLDILLDRVTRTGQPPIWLFSSETLRGVPRAFDELNDEGVDRFVPQSLKNIKVFAFPVWRLLIVAFFIVLALVAASLLTRALIPLLVLLIRRTTGRDTTRYLPPLKQPLRLLVLALLFRYLAEIALSLLGRTLWTDAASILVVAGVSWFLIQASNIVSDVKSQQLVRLQATDQIAVLALARRVFKILVLFFAIVYLLRGAGVDVRALLAGLGIGGIALAFGAQKTLEDLLGGITIIIRRVVRVGDFCLLAGVTGTVEDIGLGSTRVRTNDRTIVSIPNSKISQVSIENYTMRDKIWFHHVFGLRYDTSADQIRSVLSQISRMMRSDARVETESARIRLIGFGPSSMNLEIYAYVKKTDFAAFLEVQEDLMLRIMDIIAESGVSLALPSQITYLGRDKTVADMTLSSTDRSDSPLHALADGESAASGGRS